MDLLALIEQNGESTPKELSEQTGISRQYLHRQLNQLAVDGRIRKIGSSPMTFYQAIDVPEKKPQVQLFESLRKTIEDHFLQITVTGELLHGVEAFTYWCQRNQLPVQETGLSYEMIIKRHERYKSTYRCIDGTDAMKQSMGYGKFFLNQLLYLDYKELERFGQTKLGYLLHFAKISQNRSLAQQLINLIKYRVEKLIGQWGINAIAFIPATEKREIQLMKLMENQLSFNLPVIKLVKVNGNIAVPQKVLDKLADRIENARTSIVPVEKRQFRSVLLIDDEVVSGATLNEIAFKLKQRNIAKVVYGLSVTGRRTSWSTRP